jgi:hypothetical protein
MLEFEDGTYSTDEVGAASLIPASFLKGTGGYIVSIRSIGNRNAGLNPGKFPTDALIGRWTDKKTGLVHWDEVEFWNDLPGAMLTAKLHGEIAIWDCANEKEIRL